MQDVSNHTQTSSHPPLFLVKKIGQKRARESCDQDVTTLIQSRVTVGIDTLTA